MTATDEPRELSLEEIRSPPMEQIDKIVGLLPLRNYRTPKAADDMSSHVLDFGAGVTLRGRLRPHWRALSTSGPRTSASCKPATRSPSLHLRSSLNNGTITFT